MSDVKNVVGKSWTVTANYIEFAEADARRTLELARGTHECKVHRTAGGFAVKTRSLDKEVVVPADVSFDVAAPRGEKKKRESRSEKN